MRSLPNSLQHLATKARHRVAIRRIDPIGRAAYGALCVAGMAALAVPVMLIAGVILSAIELVDADVETAVAYGLGALVVSILSGCLFLGLFYAAYPLASDWITEWAGYAVGLLIAAGCLVLMAVLLFVAPLPPPVAFFLPIVLAFATGFSIAGRLAGMRAPTARPRTKARTLRRP